VADLLIVGGTVVTAAGSSAADVAVADGRITAVGEGLAKSHPGVVKVDATGLLVLPGCIDVHTHTRLPSQREPDRFFADSVAAAHGGTTTFLAFNNPGTGISSVVYAEGVAGGRIGVERMVDLLATTPARLFGLPAKGAVEVGRDADLVLFDPEATRTIRQSELHHVGDFTPYEGREVRGAVRSVFLRGTAVIRDGSFVGARGTGRFTERTRQASSSG
jgi:dihydroorotase-like cyclic amidohydrolase